MLNKDLLEGRANFVADTSALVSNPKILETLANKTLYIPMEVLEELDNLKTRMDEVGKNARQVNRILDNLREQGSLKDGVQLSNGQTIKITIEPDALLKSLKDTTDNRIISIAFKLNKKHKGIVVLTNDIAFRIKCDSLGLSATSITEDSVSLSDDIYTGLMELEVTDDIIDSLFEDKYLKFDDIEFYPNQGILLLSDNSKALCTAKSHDTLEPLFFTKGKKFNVEGVYPRSMEQTIALELLLDTDIPLVTLNGIAGSGKTLLAIASAMSQLHEGEYKKILISRPIESTSKDIGFLPGEKKDKMAPWVQPIMDNLEVLYRKKNMGYITQMFDKGQIEIEAVCHVRGRTLPDTFFIIDEAQNISRHEAKALLTRMGERSKIVLIGDLEQIDSPKLTNSSSGLNVIIEAFKETKLAGHVKLRRGERSALATYAAKVL